MDVEMKRLDEDNKTRFNETVNAIHESHNQDYMEILANPDWATPEDRAEAIRILNENTRVRFDNAAAVAQVELTWTPPAEKKKTPAEIEAENKEETAKKPGFPEIDMNIPSPWDYQNIGSP